MLNQEEKKAVLKRLRYVKGQIDGIERMINSNRSLQETFIQLKAIEQGIQKAIYVVFEEQLKKHLAEVLSKRLAACPGNCSDAERLQFTKQQFANLDLKGIIQSLTWLVGEDNESSASPIQKRRRENES